MRKIVNQLLARIVAATCAVLMCAPAALSGNSQSDVKCQTHGVKEAIKGADTIFVGTVVSSHREIGPDGEEWRVRLKVEDYWKGEPDEDQIVYTRGGCHVSFEAGKRYLVYARRQEGRGRLITDHEMKTGPADGAAEDLAKLGKPKLRRPRDTE
jgi:hypothetical protein